MLGPLEQALSAPDGALAPPQRAELEVVHRNGLRLLKLVNTLLDFARIEAGRIEASYAPTDLAACTADLASVFRSAIERAGLRLVVDCPPLPEAVYVDRDMWEKIVLNLLSNACKFTFAGQIAVRLAWGGAHVALAVRDTGTGIPAHELPHIFARFHRIRDARARTHEGTGIGLALVQELVRLHGGQITVESAVGIGTTFMVTLPTGTAHLPADRLSMTRMLASTALGADAYVQEALHWLPGAPERPSDVEVPFPHTPVSPLPSTPTHGRILLADDNADMRAYVQRLLSPHWEVEAVADGTQALAVANERLPDLVLADVMMPGLDGFALLRALRADLRTATIPVILLSARAGEESRVEGMEAGADDYLIKPFSARELLARVESHIKMARFRHEAAAAIRESERRLSTLIASLPGMAYRCRNDRQWTMEFVSDRVTDITGYTPEDFTSGRIHWAHLWHPDDVEWTWEAVQSASREQRPFQFEYRIRHKDGSERWIWEQGRAVLDGASQPTVCEGFVTDVTERRQAEEALRQSHAELRLHMDEMARFNRVAVGREMRLVELKQEVNALRERHGESARYPLDLEPAKAEPPSVSRLPGEEGDGLVPLEAILCTEALHQRPRRAPAYKVENRALAALVQALADSPRSILQTLAEKALEVLRAGSAGLSLLTKDARRFYYAAIAGLWQPHLGGGTPRDFGPCGDVLDRNAPLLFSHWERRYPYLLPATPLAEEGLLVPFYVDGRAVGTIWAIAHDDRRKFDAEDLRLLESLGRFASAAYQAVESLNAFDQRRAALSLMEDAVQARQLVESLNEQLRREAAERQQAAEALRARGAVADPL
jgi:PAS domain S-box-containing protein